MGKTIIVHRGKTHFVERSLAEHSSLLGLNCVDSYRNINKNKEVVLIFSMDSQQVARKNCIGKMEDSSKAKGIRWMGHKKSLDVQ